MLHLTSAAGHRILILASFGLLKVPWIRRMIRRALHGVIVRFCRWRSRRYPLTEVGSCLVIAPHPDDETLGCGGLIFHKRLKSQPVDVIYVTDGSASHVGHPVLTPDQLAKTRADEARTAMRFLGVEESALHFMGYQDGTLAQIEPNGLVQQLTDLIRKLQPVEIFLPWRHDGSSEHDAIFVPVKQALAAAQLDPTVYEYPVWSWWNPLRAIEPMRRSRTIYRLPLGDGQGKKRAALALYRSQIEAIPPWPSAVFSPDFVSFFFGADEFYYYFGDSAMPGRTKESS